MSFENDHSSNEVANVNNALTTTGVKAINIFVTDADRHGSVIADMSNFFSGYIQQQTTALSTDAATELVASFPMADVAIIGDLIHHAEMITAGEYAFLPDFDNLPRAIKAKLKKGLYTIGKSKQVDGNWRPVILDENGVRVKDITLKRVLNDPGTLETSRNIANQMQMRQIYAKLTEIQEMQDYQIDIQRNQAIVVPFLNARTAILDAQSSTDPEDQKKHLEKAYDYLDSAINGLYADMRSVGDKLVKQTRWPIFQNRKQIQTFIGFMTTDLQLVAKFVGVHLQVCEYLGRPESAKNCLERYKHSMKAFCQTSANSRQQTLAELVHLYFPYSERNRDFWLEFSDSIIPALEKVPLLRESSELYLISVEDDTHGED